MAGREGPGWSVGGRASLALPGSAQICSCRVRIWGDVAIWGVGLADRFFGRADRGNIEVRLLHPSSFMIHPHREAMWYNCNQERLFLEREGAFPGENASLGRDGRSDG